MRISEAPQRMTKSHSPSTLHRRSFFVTTPRTVAVPSFSTSGARHSSFGCATQQVTNRAAKPSRRALRRRDCIRHIYQHYARGQHDQPEMWMILLRIAAVDGPASGVILQKQPREGGERPRQRSRRRIFDAIRPRHAVWIAPESSSASTNPEGSSSPKMRPKALSSASSPSNSANSRSACGAACSLTRMAARVGAGRSRVGSPVLRPIAASASAAFAAFSSASAHRVAVAGGTTRLMGP